MSETIHSEANSSHAARHTSLGFYDDGHLRVEHNNYYVSLCGRQLRLLRKEFLILSKLARNPERVVPSEDIWQHAWGTRALQRREPARPHLPTAPAARRLRPAHRDDGQRRVPPHPFGARKRRRMKADDRAGAVVRSASMFSGLPPGAVNTDFRRDSDGCNTARLTF